MDPHVVLGVSPTASAEEITARYRRLAKQAHPDRGGGDRRMAEINSAYELLRATEWTRASGSGRKAVAREHGAWLVPAIRSALGHELLAALEVGERVWIVTPTTTRASPQTLLAASDRRLLWLLDDSPVGRVQTLRFAAIEHVEHRLRRPRRRVAVMKVRAHDGRRHVFGQLRPATAAALCRRIARA